MTSEYRYLHANAPPWRGVTALCSCSSRVAESGHAYRAEHAAGTLTRYKLSSLLFQGGRNHLLEIAFVANDHSTLTLLKFLLDTEAADTGANGRDSKKKLRLARLLLSRLSSCR